MQISSKRTRGEWICGRTSSLTLVVVMVLVAAVVVLNISGGSKAALQFLAGNVNCPDATALTGVYYEEGADPTKCFKLLANPNGDKMGFEILPSNYLASEFVSGSGMVVAEKYARGPVMLMTTTSQGNGWDMKATGFEWKADTDKKLKFFMGGRKYLKRANNAPWTCVTGFGMSGAISGDWIAGYFLNKYGPTWCQIISFNPDTGGFVMYYPPVVSKGYLRSGAGYYDAAANKGEMTGYNIGSNIGEDGRYKIKLNATKTKLEMYSQDGVTPANNGAFDFVKQSTCAASGYPTISQTMAGITGTWTHFNGAKYCMTIRENGIGGFTVNPGSEILAQTGSWVAGIGDVKSDGVKIVSGKIWFVHSSPKTTAVGPFPFTVDFHTPEKKIKWSDGGYWYRVSTDLTSCPGAL